MIGGRSSFWQTKGENVLYAIVDDRREGGEEVANNWRYVTECGGEP
jgi:hypothetical protein